LDLEQKIIVAVIALALVGIILLIIKLRRQRRGTCRLERDPTGFWRYAKDTQYQRKVAYAKALGEKKSKDKESKEDLPIAVINFDGDVRAKQHKTFARLVDEVEVNSGKFSEVVVVINSPGGLVSPYGHAFAQMERLRGIGPKLTVCIDVIAASGGYLMSLPAHHIIAAPFSIVGSVGVAAFVPNIRQLLLKWKVNPRTFTAGKYKRTVTLTDDATKEEQALFQSKLESVHRQFINVVRLYRPDSKIEEVETGLYWTAQESVELELGLVDEIGNSHEYLLKANKRRDVVCISGKKSFFEENFGSATTKLIDEAENRIARYSNEI